MSKPIQVTREIDSEAQGKALALLSDNDLDALTEGVEAGWHIHREPTEEERSVCPGGKSLCAVVLDARQCLSNDSLFNH